MFVQSRWWASLVFGLFVSVGSLAQGQSWRPALGDADELYDAAEDLHDRAERFRDVQAMQVTSQLEHLSADLYQLLKRNACAAEVLPVLNATGATLEQASLLVSLSCHLRDDRKAQAELANAQRYYAETVEHIQCALQHSLPNRPVYRAPTWQAPVPSWQAPAPTWYQAPVPQPYVDPRTAPYGYEVRYQQPAPSPGKALARVLVQQILQ